MAKRDTNRLGTKPATPSGLRETQHAARLRALAKIIEAISFMNVQERTNVLAAAAEFYGLSLTVEN